MSSGLTSTFKCRPDCPHGSPGKARAANAGPGCAICPRGKGKVSSASSVRIEISNVLRPNHLAKCVPTQSVASTCGPCRFPIGLIYARPASVFTSVAPVLVSTEPATYSNRVGCHVGSNSQFIMNSPPEMEKAVASGRVCDAGGRRAFASRRRSGRRAKRGTRRCGVVRGGMAPKKEALS